ncbi:YND1 [Candida theae]|uniref:YND1 n=1 Tax=Candida theae TaxID=1198502 RepID=A0AAD5BCS1_9ASCO|nr:YND1 [Candida theae]KAI5953056.1 YND1 [Candida theae]
MSNNAGDQSYGIVIDSGSSGSRIQIYNWVNPKSLARSDDPGVLQSPPKISIHKDWTKKITPGISTFKSRSQLKQVWSKHYSELLKFAETIIPSEKHNETPVFVLSTAGMRLVPKKTRDGILAETCSSIRKNTKFYLPDCEAFVQTIDGSTEGIYGWLGLNYLMGQFNNYDSRLDRHESIGFMDMGGASTQIAFVPSSVEQIEKHNNDLSKVILRNVNGENQKWNVFVETWLGFGANEARRRFLEQMINLSLVNEISNNNINDPCLPKGAAMDYAMDGKSYKINGAGNYETCIKSIYPLLMKSIPCEDEPCLFNGIHGPKMDFEKDKFVGISEYWYTANDIFHSGGEYDYKAFNIKVKEFCENDWDTILKNAETGDYSNLDPDKFLKDACFKASWVMNILHEGFELPRIGFETDSESQESNQSQDVTNKHVPFKSADSVGGEELSWTLGKILLFASSQIEPRDPKEKLAIGIYPSEISGKNFVPGGVSDKSYLSDHDSDDEHDSPLGTALYSLTVLCFFVFLLYKFVPGHFGNWKGKIRRMRVPVSLRRGMVGLASKVPGLDSLVSNYLFYDHIDQNIDLEEGVGALNNGTSPSLESVKPSSGASVLRTRSAIELDAEFDESRPSRFNSTSPSPGNNNNNNNNNNNYNYNTQISDFLNRPFVVPNRGSFYQSSARSSRESLSRSMSNLSSHKSKTSME